MVYIDIICYEQFTIYMNEELCFVSFSISLTTLYIEESNKA